MKNLLSSTVSSSAKAIATDSPSGLTVAHRPVTKRARLRRGFAVLVGYFILVAMAVGARAQTTYDWLDTAPDGNWRQGASGARWNPGGLFDQPAFGILRFNNNHQLTMTNNVSGTYNMHGLNFGSSGTSARTIGGNTLRLFDSNGTDPFITNASSATHVLNLNLEGDGDGPDPLKINLNSTGGLTFNGTINNQGSFIDVVGSTSSAVTALFTGVISGSGGFFKDNSNTTATLRGANTYAGATIISGGTLAVDSNNGTATGGLIGTASITVNSGGTLLLTQSGGAASNDRINNAAGVSLNGGTMRLASVSEGARGSAGVGALTLSSAAGVVSTIDFSGSASILQFSGFAQTTNGSILNITNWGGNLAGNGAEQLLFSGSAASFTSTFGQNEIQFGGISGYNILDSGAFFEIVPVPEPSTWVAGILTLLAIGWPQRRRLRGLIAK